MGTRVERGFTQNGCGEHRSGAGDIQPDIRLYAIPLRLGNSAQSGFAMVARGKPISQETPAPPASVPLKPDARVQIDIEHQFAKAHASVWLDNKLVYSRDLYSTTKPRMLVFRRRSHAHVSEMVQLPAGKHRMRVRLQSVSDAFDETKAFPAILKPNSENTLRIDVNKKNKQLQIELKNL